MYWQANANTPLSVTPLLKVTNLEGTPTIQTETVPIVNLLRGRPNHDHDHF